jgi:hypothetical protein
LVCIHPEGLTLWTGGPDSLADGGGPGTYSQLLLIKEYTSRLAVELGVTEEELYPADYFDMMGGVGFGGCAYSSYHNSQLNPSSE